MPAPKELVRVRSLFTQVRPQLVQYLRTLLKDLVRTAPLVHPQPGLRDRVWRAKYCIRGLARAALTRQWFRLLQTPTLAWVIQSHPHIFSKLQRAYLTRTLRPAQRLEILKNHYAFTIEHFSQESIREIYTSPGSLLAELPPKLGRLTLRLAYCHSLGKEGELTVRLDDDQVRWPIYSLTFSVTNNESERREIWIGGLQGYTTAHDKARVIAITRGMHGLRPKALVFFVLQQLALGWNVKRIRAVSDRMHIYQHYLRRKTLAARYDDFWTECGGVLAPDHLFDLPLVPSARPLASLKPGKRAMYRHRYEMLEQLARQIRARLNLFAPRHQSCSH